MQISVGGLLLRTPLANASGVLEWSAEAVEKMVSAGAGAVVLKTTTKEYRVGYNRPRVVKVPGGWIVAVGLANPGAEQVSRMVGELKKAARGVPVIGSVAGTSVREFVEVAAKLEEGGADALELNLSCPHFKGGGLEMGQDPATSYEIVNSVASVVKVPVIAKLGLSDKVVEVAVKSLEGGAKALSLINTIRSMKIDVYSKKPVLGYKYGGLGGEAIHPIAVRVIYDVYKETRADIFGVGGVRDWESALELMLAGAKAVQVGSALMDRGEIVISEILRGLEKFLWAEGFESVEEVVGLAHRD
ncbi:MAG: dihydroorotate dehydrogenase PyrD [Acidilobaceae archaeon]|nr:dihydroorotate dehydrogenase PyrD [Acidilobaceae archaeon]